MCHDKTVWFRYTLFINCFSVICLKSVSQRDTAVSSQKRPKSVLDTDNPYQVACLLPPPLIPSLGSDGIESSSTFETFDQNILKFVVGPTQVTLIKLDRSTLHTYVGVGQTQVTLIYLDRSTLHTYVGVGQLYLCGVGAFRLALQLHEHILRLPQIVNNSSLIV